jgi:hypothetical protein
MRCWFHKWGKWEPYTWQGTKTAVGVLYPSDIIGKSFPCTEQRQKRVCERCGKMQDELVSMS